MNPPQNGKTISDGLRAAIQRELANAERQFKSDCPVMLQIAIALRAQTPDVFDLSNPLDRLVWLFSGGEL